MHLNLFGYNKERSCDEVSRAILESEIMFLKYPLPPPKMHSFRFVFLRFEYIKYQPCGLDGRHTARRPCTKPILLALPPNHAVEFVKAHIVRSDF